ncbi:MAG: hypothetical protein HOW97_21645 [Catenulispora sp.]|nr:hypothetical protein [Catenulispora sp.]
MRDEQFGDEVSGMLHRQAQRHPDHPDPVGVTREHVRAARVRRQKATLSGVAVTAAVATVGVVWGTQAFAGNGGGGGPGNVAAVSSGTSTGATRSPHPTGSTPSGTPTTLSAFPPDGVPSTPPTGDDVVHGCDPNAILVMTAANFTWPARGTLAHDTTVGATLLQRATTLTGGKNAKLAYAGENATTRIAVVFVDPQDDGPCGPGLRAVVFHGPHGTTPDLLSAQIGAGLYGPEIGFQWSERNPDGSLSLLLLTPQTVRTLRASGTLGTKNYSNSTTIPTKDGSLLTTYSPNTPAPSIFDFTDPTTTLQGAAHVNPVVTAPTPQALATATATDPATITRVDSSAHLGIAFKIGDGPRFALRPTTPAPGAEAVYWSDFT